MRLAYNFAIVTLGDRAFLDAIVLALGSSGSAARRARDYILELGPSIAPDLYPYLNDRDAEVRGALCDVLAQLGDVGAVPQADAPAGRSELEGRRPRQPRDREAPPGRGRGGADAVSPGRGRRRSPRCCCRAPACRPAGGATRPGPAVGDPLAEARALVEERRFDEAIARLPDERRRRGAVPARAGPGRARRRRRPSRRPLPGDDRSAAGSLLKPEEARALAFYERAVAARPDHARAHLAIAELLAPHALVASARGQPGRARGGVDASVDRVLRSFGEADPGGCRGDGGRGGDDPLRPPDGPGGRGRRRVPGARPTPARGPRPPGAVRGFPRRAGGEPGGRPRAVRPGAHLAARTTPRPG